MNEDMFESLVNLSHVCKSISKMAELPINGVFEADFTYLVNIHAERIQKSLSWCACGRVV